MSIYEHDIIGSLRMFGPLTKEEIKEKLEMRQIFLSDKKLDRHLNDCLEKKQIKLADVKGLYKLGAI